jgi:sterol desaturase/sphingolipid hydroxylase (fatty acid hydroxylase superfamily)
MHDHDSARLGIFIAVIVALVVWESAAPDRARTQPRLRRWVTNLGLYAIGAVFVRVIAPVGLVGVAMWAQGLELGVLPALGAPVWLAFGLALLVLDAALYAQHRAMHSVPILWRIHAPHHADPDLDVSSGLRFHPLEFVVSFVFKAAVIVMLGAPPEAVAVFEIVLNAFSLFSHANARLPAGVERALSAVIVTPRVHRLHHDRDVGAYSGNYGFSILLWDRLFATHAKRNDPQTLGIAEVSGAQGARLWPIVILPMRMRAKP